MFVMCFLSLLPQAQPAIKEDTTPHAAPVFATVKVGGREWMASNLDAATYRNGDSIPRVSDFRLWQGLKTGAWCDYGNDGFNTRTFGRLYNWMAVADPRGLCPTGWHVPDLNEWLELADSLGGLDMAGGPLKNTVNWSNPNSGATNASGFAANPGGFRYENGYSYLGEMGYWWCADEEDSAVARNVVMTHRERGLYPNSSDKTMGLSVRCVKDPN
jgi:uncharacterized protein (TIGR02145 family)